MSPAGEKDKSTLKDMLNDIIEGKVNANWRYVDEVLEKIQDANHRYYLEKMVIELAMSELEEKAGNAQAAFRHKVTVDTYKGILEKSFGISTAFPSSSYRHINFRHEAKLLISIIILLSRRFQMQRG